jgi:hypothetical protein
LNDWRVANQAATINAKLFLDEKFRFESMTIPFSSCLSTPFYVDGRLAGIFVMYSDKGRSFSDEHCSIANSVLNEFIEAHAKVDMSS